MRVTEMLQTKNAFPLELRIDERVLKVRWAERGGRGRSTIIRGRKILNPFAANLFVMEKPDTKFASIKYMKNTYERMTF